MVRVVRLVTMVSRRGGRWETRSSRSSLLPVGTRVTTGPWVLFRVLQFVRTLLTLPLITMAATQTTTSTTGVTTTSTPVTVLGTVSNSEGSPLLGSVQTLPEKIRIVLGHVKFLTLFLPAVVLKTSGSWTRPDTLAQTQKPRV